MNIIDFLFTAFLALMFAAICLLCFKIYEISINQVECLSLGYPQVKESPVFSGNYYCTNAYAKTPVYKLPNQ